MIFREFKVNLPADAHQYSDGRVVKITATNPYTRRIIGWACDDGKMHPTNLYFQMYPEEWKEQYPGHAAMIHPPCLGVGLFSILLAIGTTTGLYPALNEVYSPEIANGLMDFAMFSMRSATNCASTVSAAMSNQLLFSIMPYADTWFTNLFNKKMDERRNNIFRTQWFYACLDNGLEDVYLSIDGTNTDYVGNTDNSVEKRHGKSGGSKTIISCIWVVCANGDHRGLPLTYFVTDGNVVDGKAVQRVIQFLRKFHLNILGVLADRGFCTESVFKMLHDECIDFVIMMKENTTGYKTIMNQHSREIRENAEYVLQDGHQYGIVGTNIQLLEALQFRSNVALIYDTRNGCTQRDRFMADICCEVAELNDKISKGKNPEIPAKFRHYITYSKGKAARLNVSEVQQELDSKGFYALATSLHLNASDIDDIYHLRDATEKVFSEVKVSLGFKTIRSHKEQGVMNRFFAVFISTILRTELMNACKRHKLQTEDFIIEASGVGYSYIYSKYDYDTPLSAKLGAVFADFDVDDDSIRSLGNIVRIRFDAEEGKGFKQKPRTIVLKSRRKHKMFCSFPGTYADTVSEIGGSLDTDYPDEATATTMVTAGDAKSEENSGLSGETTDIQEGKTPGKRGRKPQTETDEEVEHPKGPGRGRVKGSKNKKTIERERLIAEGLLTVPPKRPRGRPRKATEDDIDKTWIRVREIAKERGVDLPEKRNVGRPTKFVKGILDEIAQEA